MSALATSAFPETRSRLLPPGGAGGYRTHLARHGALPHVRRRDPALLAAVEASGLTGRGGAAFPTATKLAAVAGRRRTTVVANGVEGEPASAKDKVLLAHNPHLVLDGLVVAARLVGARESTIAVAADAAAAARAVERAIAERPVRERPRLVLVPDRFVAGEESALVNAVSGRPAKPTGKRPFAAGTLVQNVETLAHLALVARYGAAWFRAAGTDSEPGTALATVGGAVEAPGVVELDLGTTLGDLFARCGGLVEPVDAVLVGGYFGRWLPFDPELELSNEALRAHGASLGARVIVAFPRSACGLAEVARVARYMARESAGQCGPCVFGLPALADALEAIVDGRDTDAALRRVPRLHAQIARRGACAHPDGTLAFVRSGLEVFAADIDRHRRGTCRAATRR
ncbi:MAG TPA: NADH-ubiquinone oxidoreductase-F iron-sulfur binding region domain-containing protein [Gaiellaceae bacterium]|nr:NADH-ubiquinone oxidoreductase-F iron-sulfur binding region domain-containing protein [Gaiellaceae bacterium]